MQKCSLEPIFDIGALGMFDDNGVLACSVLQTPSDRAFLYYVGFERSYHVRYRLLTGLAISDDGGETFCRHKVAPILECSHAESYFRCGPHVSWECGIFRMWYVAGSSWTTINGKAIPVYDIRYAESNDGINWPESGALCLPITRRDEHGFGRPYVLRRREGLRLFYSVRRRSHHAYRIGMAGSFDDGKSWVRRDEEVGIDVSPDGWDSEAVCYLAPFEIRNRLLAFYNGNDFGRSGFGMVIWQD